MKSKYLIEIVSTSAEGGKRAAKHLQTVAGALTEAQLAKLAEVALRRPDLIQKAMQLLSSPLASLG